MIQIAGNEIPNLINELTIEQFDKLFEIDSDQSLDTIEKWIAKFTYLGADESVFDDLDLEQFTEYIKRWNDQPMNLPEKVLSIEIDGYTYEAKETIGVKDLGLIEKVWRGLPSERCAQTLAIVFKRNDLTKVEHYAPAHLKKKTKLFTKVNAEIAIPYMTEILRKINNITEKKVEEVATEVTE